MTTVQGRVPLAATLLAICMHTAYAAGAGAGDTVYAEALGAGQMEYAAMAGIASGTASLASPTVGRGARPSDGRPATQLGRDDRHAGDWSAGNRASSIGNGGNDIGATLDWRDLKAGLSHRLGRGWSLSGTYGRTLGSGDGAAIERYASAMPRPDLRPLPGTKGRRGSVVMTLSRSF